MNRDVIMAIRMDKRRINAQKLQQALSENGCTIRMRLGLHEAGEFCSDEGLILLQLVNQPEEIALLKQALDGIEGIRHQTMEI